MLNRLITRLTMKTESRDRSRTKAVDAIKDNVVRAICKFKYFNGSWREYNDVPNLFE